IAMLAATAAALAIAPAAVAQQKDGMKVGLGVSLETFNTARFGAGVQGAIPLDTPVSVYVPIQISPQLRIEPSIGFTTFSQDAVYAEAAGVPESGYAFDLGVGVLFYPVPAQPAGFYMGGRAGLVFAGFTISNAPLPSTDVSWTNFYLKGVLGGEYFLAPKFSVGLEAQIGATFFGDEDVTGQVTLSRDLVGFNTSGLVFVRYFF
ncbi:MAG TPA: outer membrane beta-barrel protein, partial [Anaeromyxobacteraceae bacterium]|nr:outer membrane beta-barrel protein [Anaeromyxobacteraceae bacterium]